MDFGVNHLIIATAGDTIAKLNVNYIAKVVNGISLMAWKVIKPKKPVADADAMLRELTRAMDNVIEDGYQYIENYPPARTRYRRTGRLRRSWSKRVISSRLKVEGIVESNSATAPYNKFVQGENQVSWAQRYGWRNQGDLANRMKRRLSIEVDKAIRKAT